MAKYATQCGPNAVDHYDDYVYNKSYYKYIRNHNVTGTGVMTSCNTINQSHSSYYNDNYTIEEGITELANECLNSETVTSVSLPSTLEVINDSCFRKSQIPTISLPEGLKKIGHNNFPSTLYSLTIPPLIKEFYADNVFCCSKLSSITVDKRNTHFQAKDGILYNFDMTEIVCCPHAWTGRLIIPNTVKRISDYCFANCKNIISITIPTSVVEIGNNAFQGFQIDKLIIRNSVKTIGESCFWGANIKQEFKFSQQISVIPYCAFGSSNIVSEFKIFARLTRIEEKAFTFVSSQLIPSAISLYATEEIGEEAFSGTTKLNAIELFSPLKTIEDRAFNLSNKNLNVRYFSYAPIRINMAAFDGIGEEATLIVPKGTKFVYENTIPWSRFPYIEEWDINIDIDGNGEETIVSDDVFSKRLRSIAESIADVDREFLHGIISDLSMDYLNVETDEEYEQALAFINYNRSFSPAIIPDLEKRICHKWASKYKLKLINKALIDSPATPLMMTEQVNEVALPVTGVLSLPSTCVEPNLISNNVCVFFNEDILKQLQNELSLAQKSVKIAVSWFTNFTLFKQLKEMAESGIKILLIINNDLINNGGYCLDLNQLIDAGVEISLVEYPHLLHHKFCIIDEAVVINGSYNWTRFSAKNYENIIVIKDNETVVNQFIEEFANILNNAEHKRIDKMPDQVPVRPEYDRSAFKQYVTEELDAQARETSDERDKITALQNAARLNPEYLERINPEAKKKYAEAFKVVEDAAAIQKDIVAMVENEPTSATNRGNGSQQPPTATNPPASSIIPSSGNITAPSNVKPVIPHTPSHTITQKEAAVIQQVKASGLVMVLDVSGSMGGTYQDGHVHSITKKALSAALSITDTKEVDVWKFGSSASFFKTIGVENIGDIHSIYCQNEGTELNKFVEKANSSIVDGALVIIFTDDDSSSIQNAIPGMKNRPNVFWQIIVYGTSSANISNAISDAANTSVVSMTNYATMDDTTISQVLLKGYITWKKGRLNK